MSLTLQYMKFNQYFQTSTMIIILKKLYHLASTSGFYQMKNYLCILNKERYCPFYCLILV